MCVAYNRHTITNIAQNTFQILLFLLLLYCRVSLVYISKCWRSRLAFCCFRFKHYFARVKRNVCKNLCIQIMRICLCCDDDDGDDDNDATMKCKMKWNALNISVSSPYTFVKLWWKIFSFCKLLKRLLLDTLCKCVNKRLWTY